MRNQSRTVKFCNYGFSLLIKLWFNQWSRLQWSFWLKTSLIWLLSSDIFVFVNSQSRFLLFWNDNLIWKFESWAWISKPLDALASCAKLWGSFCRKPYVNWWIPWPVMKMLLSHIPYVSATSVTGCGSKLNVFLVW